MTSPRSDHQLRQVAPCRTVDNVEIFFPDGGHPDITAKAKAICRLCPIDLRTACLQAALDGYEHGVWGGTTESERRNMRRARASSGLKVAA
jgi:WhiB family redox-sensing transcriptional regulator